MNEPVGQRDADHMVTGEPALRRLLDAIMAIGSELSLPVVLRRITEIAADLVDARYAALGVLDETGSALAEFVTVGLSDEEVARIDHRPEGHGILGLLILEPRPLRLPDLKAHPDSFGFPAGHPPMASFLGVPILVRGQVYGNLYLTDKTDGNPFSQEDEDLSVGLAAAAGVAIDNARLHEQSRYAALLDERERIAANLHDDVIQRLFATGLSLQAAVQAIVNEAVAERVARAVDDIDESIRQIRSTIFELNQRRSGMSTVRSMVVSICHESSRALGYEPNCEISGPVDECVTPAIRGHLALCMREGLSNVARHANATDVTVRVVVADGWLRLGIIDNGVGYRHEPGRPTSGLANMRHRAESLGGLFSIQPFDEGGTISQWQVPIQGEAS